jgi:hypothetical protein
MDRPHCHTGGNAPDEYAVNGLPNRWCVYGGIGCNVDHDRIARNAAVESYDTLRQITEHEGRTAPYR